MFNYLPIQPESHIQFDQTEKPKEKRRPRAATSPAAIRPIAKSEHLASGHVKHAEQDLPPTIEAKVFSKHHSLQLARLKRSFDNPYNKLSRGSTPINFLNRSADAKFPSNLEAMLPIGIKSSKRSRFISFKSSLKKAASRSRKAGHKAGLFALKWTAFITATDDVAEGVHHWKLYIAKKKEIETASEISRKKLDYECKKLRKKAAKGIFLGISSISSDAFSYPSFVLGFFSSALVYASLFTVLGAVFGIAMGAVGTAIEKNHLKKLKGQRHALREIMQKSAHLKQQALELQYSDLMKANQLLEKAELLEKFGQAFYRRQKMNQFYHSIRLGAFVTAGIGSVISLGSLSVADLGIVGVSMAVLSLGIFIGSEVVRLWQTSRIKKAEQIAPELAYDYLLGKIADEIINEQSVDGERLFSHYVADRLFKMEPSILIQIVKET